MQTVNVQLQPRYDCDGEEITGYLARQDLAVTLRDLDVAGGTITTAVETGGDAARLQGSGSVPVMEADTAGRDAAIPIAAGSTDVTVTVEVRWSLW